MKKGIVLIMFLSLGSYALAQEKKMPSKMDEAQRAQMMEKKKAERYAKMQQELSLNSDQLDKIKQFDLEQKKVHAEEMKKYAEVRKQQNEFRKAQMQKREEMMKSLLTSEQLSKREELKKQQMELRKQKFQEKMQRHKKLDGVGGYHKKKVLYEKAPLK